MILGSKNVLLSCEAELHPEAWNEGDVWFDVSNDPRRPDVLQKRLDVGDVGRSCRLDRCLSVWGKDFRHQPEMICPGLDVRLGKGEVVWIQNVQSAVRGTWPICQPYRERAMYLSKHP